MLRGAFKISDTPESVHVIITLERNPLLICTLFAVSFLLVVFGFVVGVFSVALLALTLSVWAVWKAFNQEQVLTERRAL